MSEATECINTADCKCPSCSMWREARKQTMQGRYDELAKCVRDLGTEIEKAARPFLTAMFWVCRQATRLMMKKPKGNQK